MPDAFEVSIAHSSLCEGRWRKAKIVLIPCAVVFDPFWEGEASAEPNSHGGSAGASPSQLGSLSINRAEYKHVGCVERTRRRTIHKVRCNGPDTTHKATVRLRLRSTHPTVSDLDPAAHHLAGAYDFSGATGRTRPVRFRRRNHWSSTTSGTRKTYSQGPASTLQ